MLWILTYQPIHIRAYQSESEFEFIPKTAYFPFLKHVFTDDIPPKHAGVEPQCDFKSDYHGSNAAKCLVFDLRTSDFIVRLEPNKHPWKGSQNKK